MNSEEMIPIVEKIQASGCLSAQELQRQYTMVAGWETLMRIDQWDRWWEVEAQNHVGWAGKLGRRHAIADSDIVAFGLLGMVSIACGLFARYAGSQGVGEKAEMGWLAAGLLVAACPLFYLAFRSFIKLRKYKAVLRTYEDGRRAELARLAPEHRPGARICLKCLKHTS